MRSRLGIPAPAPLPTRTAYAHFEREHGPAVPLWTDYRDTVKRGWRWYYWPVVALFEVRRRDGLPRELDALADRIAAERTLPLSFAELAGAAFEAAAGREYVVEMSDGALAVVPNDAEAAAQAASYAATARAASRRFARHGLRLEDATVVDLGCGTGGLTLALSAAGAARAIGVDQDLAAVRGPTHAALASRLEAAAEFVVGDAHALELADDSIDAVVSVSVLEHLTDLGAALGEQRRVVRRGGIVFHVYDPWFSPQGGHSVCTLDFPWGHVRLTPEEVRAYLRRFRSHEAGEAIRFYEESFGRRRLTLADVRAAFDAQGFEIVEWQESRARFRLHASLLDSETLADCRRAHPRLERRDLLTDGVSAVARRR